jgi:hypothetical protein
MNKTKHFFFVFLFVLSIGVISCVQSESVSKTERVSQNKIIQETNKTDIQIESKNSNFVDNDVDVASLCNKLHELKQMPYDPSEKSDDSIYNGLMQKGKEAIPCLIEKIADTTLMNDPRQAPHIQDFRVGDAAVFMLLYITKENWQPETMLSPEYAKNWESDGVYAYFAYVEKSQNRKKLQQWWKNWMKRAERRN